MCKTSRVIGPPTLKNTPSWRLSRGVITNDEPRFLIPSLCLAGLGPSEMRSKSSEGLARVRGWPWRDGAFKASQRHPVFLLRRETWTRLHVLSVACTLLLQGRDRGIYAGTLN